MTSRERMDAAMRAAGQQSLDRIPAMCQIGANDYAPDAVTAVARVHALVGR